MTVREYIGARYVPLFIGEWSDENAYEPLSIVTYQGNSYTSRQAVPVGIPITNESFWVCTANYNAQVEAYRQEVLAFDGRITTNAENIEENTQDIETNTQNIAKLLKYSDMIVPIENIGNFDAELAAANADRKYLYIPEIDSSTALTVPNSALLIIGKWSYRGSGYALTITDGIRGNIYIDQLYCENGGGIKIDPQITEDTEHLPLQGNVFVRIMDCLGGSCFYCHNNNHVLYNVYGGINWNCRNHNCIDIKPAAGKYVGEIHFDVMHMQSTTQTCIKLDFSDGYCTGIDFGVTSIEGSKNGIHIITHNDSTGSLHSLERIFGNFRIVELASTSDFQLKLEGYARWFVGHIQFDFDFIEPSKIDLSNLTDTAYTLTRHLCAVINGTVNSTWNAVNKLFIIGKHLCASNNIGLQSSSFDASAPMPTVINATANVEIPLLAMYNTFIVKNASASPITVSIENGEQAVTIPAGQCNVFSPKLGSSGNPTLDNIII